MGEVHSSYFGVVSEGIVDDQLDVGSGGCCLTGRRHEDQRVFRGEGMDQRREQGSGYELMYICASTIRGAQGSGDAHEAGN
jgi:hypothetical protein